jgi:hypothetical protein
VSVRVAVAEGGVGCADAASGKASGRQRQRMTRRVRLMIKAPSL